MQKTVYPYKLKTAALSEDGGGLFFHVDAPFIPLQTFKVPASMSMGELDGRPLPFTLHRVFEEFEAIQIMLQNLVFTDLTEFVLNGSRYVPNPDELAEYNPESERYYLFYLEPSQYA